MATALTPENVRTRKFKDAKGREIEAFVSIDTVIRLQEDLGIDLDEIVTGDTMQRIHKDKKTLGTVLWMVCEASAMAQQIEPEDFAKSLGGDSFEDALAAMEEAIISFFRRSQRTVLRAIQAKSEQIFDLATTKVLKAVDEIDPEKALTSLSTATNSVPSPDCVQST